MKAFIRNKTRELILIGVIVIMGAVITSIAPPFLTVLNLVNILNNNAILGIMATGMMVVIVTGNIDVSVGAEFAMVTMLTATYVKAAGEGSSILVGLLIGLAIGIALGLMNGLLVAKMRLPAIVVTLGTLNVIRGTMYYVTKGKWVDGLEGPFVLLANTKLFQIPMTVYIWLAVLLLTYFLLYRTKIGRDILAVGGNKIAAQRIGISDIKAYLCAFGYIGALTGLAAVLSVSRLRIAQATNGLGYEMKLIAATVIGGTMFSGGVASILGTFLGILLLGVIENGLVLSKVPVHWQSLATGLILIIAVASSAFNRRSGDKRGKKDAEARKEAGA